MFSFRNVETGPEAQAACNSMCPAVVTIVTIEVSGKSVNMTSQLHLRDDVKKVWSYTYAPSCMSTVFCLPKDRNEFAILSERRRRGKEYK